MTHLSFGQPQNGIIQMAYVVEDIRAAIESWSSKLNTGPWFLLDHFTGVDPVYRGAPSKADVAIAMGFAGHMMIELIQPNDSHPSVYRELLLRSGPGFHHFGVASLDVEADVKRYQAMGYELAFRAGVPTGGEVAYMDSKGEMPGFVELIEANPLMEQVFTSFYAASLTWDGKDLIRSFG